MNVWILNSWPLRPSTLVRLTKKRFYGIRFISQSVCHGYKSRAALRICSIFSQTQGTIIWKVKKPDFEKRGGIEGEGGDSEIILAFSQKRLLGFFQGRSHYNQLLHQNRISAQIYHLFWDFFSTCHLWTLWKKDSCCPKNSHRDALLNGNSDFYELTFFHLDPQWHLTPFRSCESTFVYLI